MGFRSGPRMIPSLLFELLLYLSGLLMLGAIPLFNETDGCEVRGLLPPVAQSTLLESG